MGSLSHILDSGCWKIMLATAAEAAVGSAARSKTCEKIVTPPCGSDGGGQGCILDGESFFDAD